MYFPSKDIAGDPDRKGKEARLRLGGGVARGAEGTLRAGCRLGTLGLRGPVCGLGLAAHPRQASKTTGALSP